jgi:hypothetical protein
METADFSLVVERDKGVYAITPLNDVAKEWLPQNVEVISFKGANLVQENDVVKAVKTILDSEFTIEVWKKYPLLEAPNTASDF